MYYAIVISWCNGYWHMYRGWHSKSKKKGKKGRSERKQLITVSVNLKILS